MRICSQCWSRVASTRFPRGPERGPARTGGAQKRLSATLRPRPPRPCISPFRSISGSTRTIWRWPTKSNRAFGCPLADGSFRNLFETYHAAEIILAPAREASGDPAGQSDLAGRYCFAGHELVVAGRHRAAVKRKGDALTADTGQAAPLHPAALVSVLIALTTTGGQLVIQYFSVAGDIIDDLASLGRTVEPTVANAVWALDSPGLDSIVRGIRQNAIVSGVLITSDEGVVLVADGMLPRSPGQSDGIFPPPYRMEVVPPLPQVARRGRFG